MDEQPDNQNPHYPHWILMLGIIAFAAAAAIAARVYGHVHPECHDSPMFYLRGGSGDCTAPAPRPPPPTLPYCCNQAQPTAAHQIPADE